MTETPALDRARSLVRSIPDYPAPGIIFRDIMPLLADGEALRAVVAALAEPAAGEFDVVAGVEARGFLLAGAVAVHAGVGVIPLRKAGKLPRPVASVDYALEYGTATLEVHDDIPPGARVLLIDDVLATGGTLAASARLVERVGARVAGASVLIALDGLCTAEELPSTHALFRY